MSCRFVTGRHVGLWESSDMSEQSGGRKRVALHRRGSREWGEKGGLNGGVLSALELRFRTSFTLRPETTATARA
jgi:hypothetical protein